MNKVGQLLAESREALGISVEEASNKTKIQKLYLEAIEKGDFAFFKNQEFYQQVFVGSYASFLGLDKNQLLSDLVDDNKSYFENHGQVSFAPKTVDDILAYDKKEEEIPVEDTIEEVQEEVIEEQEVAEEVNTHSNPKVLKKYMYGIEDPKLKEIEERIKQQKMQKEVEEALDSTPVENDDLEEEGIEELVETDNIENDSSIESINDVLEEEGLSDSADKDISQLLDEIDANHENEEEVILEEDTISEYFVKEAEEKDTQLQEEENEIELELEQDKEELLHSNLLDEIQNINEEAKEKSDEDLLNEIFAGTVIKDDELDKASQLDSTAVIDLTSGIEMEQVSKASSQDGLISSIDDSLNINSEIKSIDEDPSRTSMDLKVAKALGDTNIELDKVDAKKIKRDRVIDVILIIVIIALLGYLVFMLAGQVFK